MRAAVVERYGPPEVVRIREVETPRPADNEVMVRVVTTAVNSGDTRVRALRVPRGLSLMMRLALGFSGPRQPILGFDAAGEVAAVGKNVRKFKPGDRVIASRGFAWGAHAEYLAVPEDGATAVIPDGVSAEDAVAIPFGGATALIYFKEGKLRAGETLLINGASGAVGTMAVQIAKHMGVEVTGVCSTANVELVKSLGADHVIDYTQEDVTSAAQTYDVIMDCHGNAPYARVKHLLKPGGRFLMVIADLFQMIAASRNKAVVRANANGEAYTAETYAQLMELAGEGVLRPVIDSTYDFEQIAEAHRRVDGGHKIGSVVVRVAEA
jgi:NADPH:quinone reductase-like Zn-dependent oxidoreductase